MEDILTMCRDVIKLGQFDDMDCIHDGCKTCPFSVYNNKGLGCGGDTDENYIKIAKEYIDEHEPKTEYTFKIGDVVTGTNPDQLAYGGKFNVVKIDNTDTKIKYGIEGHTAQGDYERAICCCWYADELKLYEDTNDIKAKPSIEKADDKRLGETTKTFAQVVTTIREDEMWESEEKTIKLNSFNQLVIEVKKGFEGAITGTQRMALDLDRKYTLQRKQYAFIEAFKAYEEGFEIEDMHGCKFKKIDGVDSYKLKCDNNFTEKSDATDFWFGFEEIRGKWHINK